MYLSFFLFLISLFFFFFLLGVKFGKKEQFMTPMNDFIVGNEIAIKKVLFHFIFVFLCYFSDFFFIYFF